MSNPELEDATWATIAAENARRSNLATQGTQQQAQRLGELHNLYPSLPAGVKLSAAKANLTDEQVRQIALASVPVDTQPKKPKQKSWFERNVMSKVKTASRYGFAGLEFIPQTVVGGAAQIFDTDDSVNGWIISTDLGSLIANDEEAGDGFFIGGRAKELQSERVRRYRGTINGEAYTIGRGLAATFLEPDTVAYRTLSGMVDAGVALAIPIVPLAKAVGKGARLVEEGASLADEGLGLVGKGLTALSQTETGAEVISKYGAASRIVGKGSKEVTVTRATAEQRELLRQQVGIVGNSIDIEQTNRFFRTGFGRKIIQRTAETNDFAETHALWGGKLDPSTTMKLANAKTEEEVMASLLDVLGTQVTDISNVKGGRKVYMSLAQRNKIIDAIPISTQGVSRTFAKMPAHNINLFQAETPRDQIRQIDTVQRVLKLFKVAGPKLGEKGEVLLNDAGEVAVPDLAKDFINRAGELLLSKDETKIAEFYDDLLAEGKNSMVRFGTAPELVDELYKVHDGYVKGARKRTVDSAGNATDDGAYRRINGLPPDADARNYIGGTLSSEFAKNEFVVPDPRQVRRLTNNYNWLWVKNKKDPNLKSLDKAGQLRMPLSAASSFQEQVWRKYITATIGNFVRNTVDSQISIALSGKTGVSPFYHPFHWMSFVNHKVGQGTVTGKQWDVIGSVENIGDELVDYRNVTGDGLTAYYKDTLALRRRATRIGQFVPYERRLDKVDYAVARAHGDEIGKLNADWSTRRMAEGLSIDELFDLIQQGDKEAVRWFTTVKSRFKSGMEIWDAPSQSVVYQKIDMNVPGNLKRLMESNAERLGRITGGNTELLDVVAQGRLTKRVKLVGPKDKITGELKIGGRVQVTQKVFVNGKYVPTTFVGKVVDETRTAKGSTFKVEPFAFSEGDNTKELEELLRNKSIYMDPRMPKQVVGEIRNPQTTASNDVVDSLNLMVDKFYSFLYTKPIATLERSPAFRNLYYEWVEKLSTSLDEQSLNKIIDDISSRTNEPEKYLTPGLWKKLQDLKANPDKLYGTLNADEVSSFASGSALDEYKKTFYNAVERRNGTDVLRLISPFAQQQAEFFGRMARFFTVPVAGGALGYLPNPENFRKIQFAVENGREADPDGDGRGIFYKDPSNGRFSVDIPIVGGLTKMATGVSANLTLPLKGISPGLDYRPGLGPVMTMATSAILSDVPSQDWIRKFLLPYGERTDLSDAFVPSWITKVYEGVTGKTDGRFFANTYVETMQALSATGEYDLSNANEIDRLKNDARDKARIFAVLRGFTQFTGPASGDFNMKVVAKGGDYHTVGLSTALQALRENNPDTSALRFIEIFGDDAFMYLANKTTSEVGGLGASKEFGDFERNNPGLFSVYPEIGGFFGPAGTDFDFEVYTRQLKTGKRRRLTDDEIIDASQKSIGMAFYRDMKRYFGPKMNKDQRDYLANYKDQIIAKYPGFGKMNLDPEETNRNIGSLFDAAKRDDLQDNKVANAVNYYEQVRNAALQEANRRGFDSLKSPQLGDLHEYLEGYAETLVQQSPDFAKVYDRLLSQEFE
jgi:hypothetical protein